MGLVLDEVPRGMNPEDRSLIGRCALGHNG